MPNSLPKMPSHRSVMLNAPAPPGRASLMVWMLIVGVLLAHLLRVWQAARLPDDFGTLDWALSGIMLMYMLGLALAYLVSWSSRRLISLLVMGNASFFVLSLALAFFEVGTSQRIGLERSTVTFWG